MSGRVGRTWTKGAKAACYSLNFPDGREGEYRTSSCRLDRVQAFVYQKDKRWYVAGVAPLDLPRPAQFRDCDVVTAVLQQEKAA